MTSRRFLLTLCLLAAFLPLAVEAGMPVPDADGRPLVVNVESASLADWYLNYKEDDQARNIRPDDYVKLHERLKMDLTWAPWFAGVRLDGYYYPDPLVVKARSGSNGWSSSPYSQNAFRPEKVYIGFDDDPLKVTLGDFYQTLGRGLALSMVRRSEDFYDNTLRGTRVEFHKERTRALAFAGLTNTLNVDLVTEKAGPDPNDLIGGLRVEQGFGKVAVVGLHATATQFAALLTPEQRRFVVEDKTLIWGGNIEFPEIAETVTLYFEGAYMQRGGRKSDPRDTSAVLPVSMNGFGLYGSANAHVADLTLLAEGKYYDSFQFRRYKDPLQLTDPATGRSRPPPPGANFADDVWYNDPPNLEKEDVELKRNDGAASGFRVRADYDVKAWGARPYANFYYSRNRAQKLNPSTAGGFGETVERGDRIWHAYGGLTQTAGPVEIIAEGGYRDEYRDETSEPLENVTHAKAAVKAAVAPKHSITGEGAYRLKREKALPVRTTNEFDGTLSYSFSGWFSASFLYTFQAYDFPPAQGQSTSESYFAGEVKSDFADWVEIALFGGEVKAGYRCFGGICRRIPKFEGLKARLVFRY